MVENRSEEKIKGFRSLPQVAGAFRTVGFDKLKSKAGEGGPPIPDLPSSIVIGL